MSAYRVPTLRDFEFKGRKVLVRVDMNSPLSKDGEILDDSRIKEHAETIRALVDSGAAVVVMSHQGRPGGSDFSDLSKHAKVLERYCGVSVEFVEDVMGPAAREAIKRLKPGEVLLLDNVRFVSEEIIEASPERQAKTFLVRRLAPLFNNFVLDAFATAHRSQPSIVGFPLVLPSCAGLVMERELTALSRVFNRSDEPRVFVLGGAKVHDTLRIIEHLYRSGVANLILTGGLVGLLFLAAKGAFVGEENIKLLERAGLISLIPRARRLLLAGAPIETPVDFGVLKNGERVDVPLGKVDGEIMDIGQQTASIYSEYVKEAKVVVMRGPLGVVEDERFRFGTRKVMEAAIKSGAFVIIGGGHLRIVASELRVENMKNVHLSTGGGALLEFLAGETLPGIEALRISAKKFLGW